MKFAVKKIAESCYTVDLLQAQEFLGKSLRGLSADNFLILSDKKTRKADS